MVYVYNKPLTIPEKLLLLMLIFEICLKPTSKKKEMEKLNYTFEEYLPNDMLKLQTDHEKLWINSLTFYKKCMNDLGQLFKYLWVQFRSTTGEDESMIVGAMTVEYMSTVLNNATDRHFVGKGQYLIAKRSGENIYYTCIKQLESFRTPILCPLIKGIWNYI